VTPTEALALARESFPDAVAVEPARNNAWRIIVARDTGHGKLRFGIGVVRAKARTKRTYYGERELPPRVQRKPAPAGVTMGAQHKLQIALVSVGQFAYARGLRVPEDIAGTALVSVSLFTPEGRTTLMHGEHNLTEQNFAAGILKLLRGINPDVWLEVSVDAPADHDVQDFVGRLLH
jgi:hypothetical protein